MQRPNTTPSTATTTNQAAAPLASPCLLPQRPLLLAPSLACLVGLSEALVLQQLHCLLQHRLADHPSASLPEGSGWVHLSYPEWVERDFPFWCPKTLQRLVQRLQRQGLLRIDKPAASATERRNGYRLDYEALQRLLQSHGLSLSPSDQEPVPAEQPDNLSAPPGTTCPNTPSAPVPTAMDTLSLPSETTCPPAPRASIPAAQDTLSSSCPPVPTPPPPGSPTRAQSPSPPQKVPTPRASDNTPAPPRQQALPAQQAAKPESICCQQQDRRAALEQAKAQLRRDSPRRWTQMVHEVQDNLPPALWGKPHLAAYQTMFDRHLTLLVCRHTGLPLPHQQRP